MFFLIILFIVVIPFIISFGIRNIWFNIIPGTDNVDWLNYWATYGGNVVGLVGLALVTIFQDRKQKKYISDQDASQKEYLNNQNNNDNNRMIIELSRGILNDNLQQIIVLKKLINQSIEKIHQDYIDAPSYKLGFEIQEYNSEMTNILFDMVEIQRLIKSNKTLMGHLQEIEESTVFDKIADIITSMNNAEEIEYDEWDEIDYSSHSLTKDISELHGMRYKLQEEIMKNYNEAHDYIINEIVLMKNRSELS